MAVDTPSVDYEEQRATWARARALLGGVESARELVTALPGMKPDRAEQFSARAYFLPAFGRTVEMFGGLLFIREPQTKDVPASLDSYLEDATLEGLPMAALAAQIGDEILTVSRCAVLVDFPPAAEGLTVAEAERQGLRAYARLYRTESILSADFERVGGVRRLSRVRLLEESMEEGAEEFSRKAARRVRVLELVEGVYQVRVFVQLEGQWILESGPTVPIRAGKPLTYIPIVFFNHRDNDPAAIRPPLADLSDVNESHLQTSALLEWGEMWTANPTPWASGMAAPPTDENGNPLPGTGQISLGSSEMLLLREGGEMGFLEFTGAGLERLAETMAAKEKHMGQIGARVLLDDPRQAIAAETARIQRAGEHSTLARISDVISRGLSAVLREFSRWAGAEAPNALYVVNKNFLPAGIDPAELTALVGAFQKGVLSSRDLFARLQAKEVIATGKTFEEHESEIEQDAAKIATSLDRVRKAADGLEGKGVPAA